MPMRVLRFATLLAVAMVAAAGQSHDDAEHPVCAPCIRAHMEFLAGDALRGRGSATADEFTAASYIATELEREGVQPAGESGSYVQRVPAPPAPPTTPAKRPSAASATQPATGFTWNVVGKIPGRDAELGKQVILLTAHLDHLGVRRVAGKQEIFHGADDDASGVSAVLDLARALASGSRPRRTVVFALFGSEETGLRGSQYFREHPPFPLADIVANLEFEMIGRPDPAIAPHNLWLTGWDRTNLGAELAAHGAHLVGDPHPKEDFFRRSDNYAFALKGVVAHTISSFGLHKDYHRPTDDLAHIDFDHLDESIGSLIGPVRWLADSDFVPQWLPGKKP
jgi:hypothetical protein